MVHVRNGVQHRNWACAIVAAVAISLPSSGKSYSMAKPIREPLHLNHASPSQLLAVITPVTFEESLSSAKTRYEEVNTIRKMDLPLPTAIITQKIIRKAANVVIEKNIRSDIPGGHAYSANSSSPHKQSISTIQNRDMKTLEDEISGVKISCTDTLQTSTTKSKSKIHSGRSSTMPGFMNRNNSGRRESFRDGLNIARGANTRAKSNKIKKVHTSKKAVNKRTRTNSEAMYASSVSVPDSMIAFASEIHQESRITPTEEIELGTQTQESIRMHQIYDDLESNLDRVPTDAEWCAAAGKINMDALRRVIDDGNVAKKRLVTSNLRMVQGVVNLYLRNGLGSEFNAGDLMQEGTVALIRAAEKFEPQRGFRFSTYAMYWIRSSVKRSQILQSRVIQVPQRIHETHKKVRRFQQLLEDELGRVPNAIELAKAVGITEGQLERCLAAIAQQCYSLDADIENTLKPNSGDARKDSRYDIIDAKFGNADYGLQSNIIKGDLVDTLRTYLSPDDADLLLMRYGLLEDDRQFTGPLTIAELSRIVGLKPDKVRRTINKSLRELRHLISHEWGDYEKDLSMS